MSKRKNYPKVFLGITNENGERIYLTPPSWGCDWYWSWGCIGNNHCHYHLSSLLKDTHLYDGIKNHFRSFLVTEDRDLWTFCELVTTFYTLKNAAEVFTRGGSNLSVNPLQGVVQYPLAAQSINTDMIPAIFEEVYQILTRYE